MELVGRSAECAVLDRLVADVGSGHGRVLVVHGEPGVGKTALLDHVAAVPALLVLRACGVQSEMELPFAGLHQLCLPLLDRLAGHGGAALRTAFGISAGPAPDTRMLGIAVLRLLAEQPVLCLVDDHQWLDHASAQVFAFVAHHLAAHHVGLVFVSRTIGSALRGLPCLLVDGLPPAVADALLRRVLTGPVDDRVREQIVAETHGNPLALLELPRALAPGELAGGFGLPAAVPLSRSIEASFGGRVAALPESVRQLLLIAASDPSGDPVLVRGAAERLGIDCAVAVPVAEASGLCVLGTRVRFRHPLARSAVYRSAPVAHRQRAHGALAAVVDPVADPDCRAWHRAQAAFGPDEEVAAELERSAGRARDRGGLAAVAAFLFRATTLTLDVRLRADRALAAADAAAQAGLFDRARDLLSLIEAGPLTAARRARADLIRARLEFVTNRGGAGSRLLLGAARTLTPIDPPLARVTYLDALSASIFAGRLADPVADVLRTSRAVAEAPPTAGLSRAGELLLRGTAAMYDSGYTAGLPLLREALSVFGAGMSVDDELHWLWLATTSAMQLCDDGRWDGLSARYVELARATGALSELPLALTVRTLFLVLHGDPAAAATLAAEARALLLATGVGLAPCGALAVAAFRGDDALTTHMVDAAVADATRRGEGVGITMAEWARAVLHNGHGRYHAAVSAARRAIADESDRGSLALPCVELVEAAVHTGQTAVALDAYRRLAEATSACGTDWALGLETRSGALLSEGPAAERLYRASVDHLGNTRLRADLARVRLLYGEWLGGQGRFADAREQLTIAVTMFETMGLTAFARRALSATG